MGQMASLQAISSVLIHLTGDRRGIGQAFTDQETAQEQQPPQ